MWPFRRSETIGKTGERLARRALRSAGCKILARNYRCGAGEADLIALAGDTLVFAEVKTRRGDTFVDPASAIDTDKRKRYRRVARYYLHRTGREDLNVRFDAIVVVLAPDRRPQVRHVPDAFQ